MFSLSRSVFAAEIRRLAHAVGHPEADVLGTHGFRRGMAQDIIEHGGTLATLLKAGDWRSGAFKSYLKDTQLKDVAVSQLVICVSDSDED